MRYAARFSCGCLRKWRRIGAEDGARSRGKVAASNSCQQQQQRRHRHTIDIHNHLHHLPPLPPPPPPPPPRHLLPPPSLGLRKVGLLRSNTNSRNHNRKAVVNHMPLPVFESHNVAANLCETVSNPKTNQISVLLEETARPSNSLHKSVSLHL